MRIDFNKNFFQRQAQVMFKTAGAVMLTSALSLALVDITPGRAAEQYYPGSVSNSTILAQEIQSKLEIDHRLISRGFRGKRRTGAESVLENIIIERHHAQVQSLNFKLPAKKRTYALLTALTLEDKINKIAAGREIVFGDRRLGTVRGFYFDEVTGFAGAI